MPDASAAPAGNHRFPNLFAPISLGPVTVRNRIVSSGHATRLADDQRPSDRFIAYHRARASGGAGLIITEASFLSVADSYSSAQLVCGDDSIIPGFRALADAIHAEGAAVFGQLLHLGYEHATGPDGTRAAALGPSQGSSERYHTAGRAMTEADIAAVITAFGDGAERMAAGRLDGVEVAASHGYLLAQFLSPHLNRRTDRWGGSFEGRLRLLREVLIEVRRRVGPDLAVGVRISGDELTTDGLSAADVVEVCAAIGGDGLVDYFNVAIGSSRQIGAAVHIVSPMGTDMGISLPFAAKVRDQVTQPVIAVGRINQPAQAEQIIASGHADLCGMTRAMICDPQMPNKAATGRVDDIRGCIACNQACIDRFHKGWGISCIQHPETGRELRYGLRPRTSAPRNVLVVGGGPAGMKAAAVAAERGHAVTLVEASRELGGQALLAERLPGRAEFGGIVTNLSREMELAGVDVQLGRPITAAEVVAAGPDAVVLATGAAPISPRGEFDGAHLVDAWDALADSPDSLGIGRNVLIADWRCDWIGLGLAELLARAGRKVRLASTGHVAGETIPRYTRDLALGGLHRLGVELLPLVRLYGADEDTVFLQHMASGDPVVVDGIDTVVLAQGHRPVDELEAGLRADDGTWIGDLDVHVIGDALAPRTAEEAVLEGLEIGMAL